MHTKFWLEKPERKRSLERTRRRWEDNIKRIVLLDFIHRLVSQKIEELKI
jgi:hypothetical protein